MRCTVSGLRDTAGEKIVATASSGGQESSGVLVLGGSLKPAGLRCAALLVKPGEPTRVELLAENRGSVVLEAPPAEITVPTGVAAAATGVGAKILPGTTGPVASWEVTVAQPTPLVRFAAQMEGANEAATSYVVCAEKAPWEAALTIPAAEAPAYAVEGQGTGEYLVGSDKVRLALSPVAGGALVGALQVPEGPAWRTVALLPHLGLLATPEGEAALTWSDGADAEHTGDGALLRLRGTTTLGVTEWATELTLGVEPGAQSVVYSLVVRPYSDAQVLALEGPMLYAEEAPDRPRDEAILPGLEWLVRGEESSGVLDIVPDHPDRIRYVPNMRKVTVPCAAMRFGDTVVGLLWGTPGERTMRDEPALLADAGPASVVFASPDRFEGHTGHLMGLFLPSVGEWVPENARRAAKPFPVAKGNGLHIRADLYAGSGAESCLDVLDQREADFGDVPQLPYPRGGVEQEIAFSLRGYLRDRALWNAAWSKWYSDLIVGFQPTDGPALDLLRGASLLPESDLTKEARALAAEALGGDARSQALRLQHRADPAGLGETARAVRGLIATQAPDGNWPFTGPKSGEWPATGVNYDVLGPTGAREVGLTAPSAGRVLQFALLTGDPEARASGLKALEAMRAFRVPRAAQVWEVPVHTPDILASAVAVDAYVLGYKLTGDAAYLRDAAYWARTGLPFVYVWAPADLPAMQGASIPVFGATGYGLSWFGVAVQWNGLAYAQSLVELSRYDDSYPWAAVADHLYRSAMYQQATEGDRLAQWPDALNLVPDRPGLHGETPPCFQPSTILHELFRQSGLHTRPETIAVRQGDRQLAIRAQAEIATPAWEGDRLAFDVAFGPGETGAVEVIPAERPAVVVVDGKALAEREDLWAGDAPGWHWHDQGPILEVRLTEGGRHSIRVEGAQRAELALLPPLRTTIDFRFTTDVDGWQPTHDLAPFVVADGLLRTQATGPDPYMSRDGLAVAGRTGDVLVVRLSLSAGGGGSVFWATVEEPGTAPARELPLPCPGDGALHEIRIPVGGHPGWAGREILQLRLDPGSDAPGASIAIESIRLERADGGK